LSRDSSVYMVGTTKIVSKVPTRHAPHDHPADLLPALGARTCDASASGNAPSTMAPVVIMIGRRRSAGDCLTASIFSTPCVAQLVGELHDQDAVLGDQAHQRDQPDLAEHVQRASRQLERQQARPAWTAAR
jgi:hypothetical protein